MATPLHENLLLRPLGHSYPCTQNGPIGPQNVYNILGLEKKLYPAILKRHLAMFVFLFWFKGVSRDTLFFPQKKRPHRPLHYLFIIS